MNTSQFMDKQIMDLSSQSHKEFIDLNNPQEDGQVDGGIKKEEILPSYDFQPIRPTNLPSSPPNFESSVVGGLGAWNSSDNNKSSPPSIMNYNSSKTFEPAKVVSEKDPDTVDTSLVSEIDRTMKKYADNLLHALDGVSARLSQLESRTHHLENSVDDLSVSVGNNHGNSDGKMRQLEHILKEVQNGVQDIKDKQEIMDAHFQLAKLHVSKVEQHEDTQQNLEPLESSQSAYSTAQLSHQQLLVQPPPTLIPPNAPLPPPSHQNVLNTGQLLNNFAQNQGLRQEPYFPPPGHTPENPSQSFQVPPQQLQAPPPPPQQQYPTPHSQYPQLPASPRQSIISNVNHPQHPPTSGYHSEETPYMQPPSYPPNIRAAAPPPPQYYGPPPPNLYEPQSSRPSPVFSGAYGPSPASSESYPYSNTSQYSNSSLPMKPQLPPPQYYGPPPPNLYEPQSSRPSPVFSGAYGPSPASSESYPYSNTSQYSNSSLPMKPQLPSARPLPHASVVGNGGPGSSASSGNKVPIDDVVERVTNMGFPRDHVRATVRKLTDNGRAVDLNVVLDKLMNPGPSQEHWRP